VSDTTESGVNKFYITDARTSEKITKSKTLELIRMTIINNMLQYHPEAADYLVEGQARSVTTLVPIRRRSRCELHPLRTFSPGARCVSLRAPPLAFDPDAPRILRLSTPLLTPFNSALSTLPSTLVDQHIEMPGDRDADANPLGARVAPAVKTSVVVDNTSGARQSKLIITTTDRPGLLVDIVATLKDLSLNVISAEIDTIGPKAYDIVYVTYQGGALNKSMIELVTNALTYHLTRRDIENKNSESY
jgi:hypothetical protein